VKTLQSLAAISAVLAAGRMIRAGSRRRAKTSRMLAQSDVAQSAFEWLGKAGFSGVARLALPRKVDESSPQPTNIVGCRMSKSARRRNMAALVLTPAFHSQATENALAAVAMRCTHLELAAVERVGNNVTLRCIVRDARAAYHAFLKATQIIFPPRGRRGWFFLCQSSDVMPYCH